MLASSLHPFLSVAIQTMEKSIFFEEVRAVTNPKPKSVKKNRNQVEEHLHKYALKHGFKLLGLILGRPKKEQKTAPEGAQEPKGEIMEKVPMTRGGYANLNIELKSLKDIERPAVIKAISEAREHGDLSENAEYHAAREKQSFIEGRIKTLESLIGRADVIDPSKMDGTTVRFGATVKLADETTGEEKTYQIVGEAEADIDGGKLNMQSPLARALIGKEEGDGVEVAAPGGMRGYEITQVRYI